MIRLSLIFLLCLAPLFPAGAEQFTLYWPHDLTTETPEWLGDPSQDASSSFATIHVPVSPGEGGETTEGADLAVTVYFVEPPDGFLRVFWVTSEEEVMLSSNLYEGVAAAHQRTVLVPNAFLGGPGVLTFQASSQSTPVYAVRFEWLHPFTLSAPADAADPAIRLSTGQMLGQREIAGVPYLPPSGGWEKDVVTVALSDRIERIENGADFPFVVESVPSQVRVAMRLAGADLSQPILVWVNGVYAGFFNVEVPVLTDEGYFEDSDGADRYAGWRAASVFLPGRLFSTGENSLQFGWTQPPVQPPAARDMTLQLRYPEGTGPVKLSDGAETLGSGPEFMLLDNTLPRPEFRFE